MSGHDVIVIGASAGGVEAVSEVVRGLPADLPAAVFVVVHFPAHATSVLPRILERAGALPVAHARDGEEVRAGRVYVAPPDRHLLLRGGRVVLGRGPRENGHRPAADPLFRSAAATYGPRVVGVVLSGNLDDGTAGLLAVHRCGGVAVVQDPASALYDGMPRSAAENVRAEHVVPLDEVAPLLARLAAQAPGDPDEECDMRDEMEVETRIAEMDPAALADADRPGTPSGFTCPECHGVLWEIRDGDELTRWRCRVGHAYAAETLSAAQDDSVETALWTAMQALKERAALAGRLADRMARLGHDAAARRYAGQRDDAERRAALIRTVLERSLAADEDAGPAPAAD